MSLLTRCPACTTLYRLVPDQLRISQGWVKCGQCGNIFDATQHLVQVQTQDSSAHETPDVTQFPCEPMGEPSLDAEVQAQAQAQALTRDDTSAAEPVAVAGEQSPELAQPVADGSTAELNRVDAIGSRPDRAAAVDLGACADERQLAQTTEPAAALLDMAELSFMRDAIPVSGRCRWCRVALLVLAFVFSGILAGQWLYRQRDDLAATLPQTRPALQVFCHWIGCQLDAIKRIDSVLIDAAAFNQLDGNGYLLSLALKNVADVPLALPSVELTLNDLQDRTVVRRVFSARELNPAVLTLPALSEWRVSVPLALQPDAAMPRVVGYRVRVFYP